MKSLFSTLLILIVTLTASARNFSYTYKGQTLVYTVLDEVARTVETKSGYPTLAGNYVEGELEIPPIVYEGDQSYTVTRIGDKGFTYCERLTSLIIGDSVKTIGQSAFDHCRGITSVVIGSSVETIDDGAFSFCSSIPSLIIPKSIKTIDRTAFNGCNIMKAAIPKDFLTPFNSNIKLSVYYPRENTTIKDGWIYSEDKSTVYFAPLNLKGNVSIPASVETISNGAYGECAGIASINIPNSVKTIESQSFINCINLDSIMIPGSVVNLEPYAFKGCTGLKKVVLPASLPTLPDGLFDKCTNLSYVKLLSKVPPKIYNTFDYDIYKRATLDVPKNSLFAYLDAPYWDQFQKFAIDGATTREYTVNDLTYLLIENPEEPEAFVMNGQYNMISSVVIPESVQVDTSVRYKVTAVGNGAFRGCQNLETVTFSGNSNVKIIGAQAFANNRKLKSINIPASLSQIDRDAFFECYDLTKVEVEDMQNLCDITFADFNSNPLSIANGFYLNGSLVKNCVIPNTVKNIKDYTFAFCKNLETVKIPNSVLSIGNQAFRECYSLASVELSNSIKTIGDYAFFHCNAMESLVIGNSVNTIGYGAFAGTGVSSVIFGNSVETIGEAAFAGCEELRPFELPGSLKTIGERAFSHCSNLTRMSIPNSVVKIGKEAFSECWHLKQFVIEDGVNTLNFGEKALYPVPIDSLYIGRNWTYPEENSISIGISEVVLGNLVKNVPEFAFKGSSKMTSLTIGSGVKQIGANAFSGCTALKKIVFPPHIEVIENSAFTGNTALDSIIIGHSVKSIGDKAFDGCTANMVCITAQTPPTAPDNVFSNYNGNLYLQGQKAYDAYNDTFYCWNKFSPCLMIEPTEMKYEGEKILSGKSGDTFQLKATLMPENVTLPQVFWRSTNPEIATVNQNGLVTLHVDSEEVMYTYSESGESTPCKIIAESLYANGPVVEFAVSYTQNGVDDIIVNNPTDESTIDYTSNYDVYNLSGRWVGDSVEGLAHGFYIVRQGTTVKKIAVK